MSIRTSEHEIGELAVTAVLKVLANAKHIVEEIDKDYGEDILVQTHHAGRMDASRMWFQVKGTDNVDRYRLKKWNQKKGEFRYSVPFDTAIRWIRSLDPVVVVLWDVEKDLGWYAVPKRQVDDWKGMMRGQKSTTLYFGSEDHDFEDDQPRPFTKGIFDVDAAKRLAWESRFEHFRLLLLSAKDAARERGRPSAPGNPPSARETLVLTEFLKLLGMIDPDVEPGHIKVNQETLDLCKDIAEQRWAELAKMDPRAEAAAVSAWTVAERVREIDPLLGMPKFMLVAGAAALATTLTLGGQPDPEAYVAEQEAKARGE